VHVDRNELAELLRSRGNDQTAVRAEQSLPQHIDLQRDRETLRQCRIDPNVLAYILSTQDRTTDVTEPPSQAATDLDDGSGAAMVDGVSRRVRAQNGPSGSGPRTAVEATNVSQLTMQLPASSDHRVDQMTTRSTSTAKEKIGFRVTSRPAIRCPRCRFAFGSPALMLDHLNVHHRKSDRLTRTSAESDDDKQMSRGVHLVHMTTADPLLTHPEVSYPRSRRFLDPRRLVIGVILANLLIVCIVAILAGRALHPTNHDHGRRAS
jgi:hypothetical protein